MEGENQQQEMFPGLLSEYQEGKDELNLAEFPIATLSTRVDPTLKTVEFSDTTFDQATGQTIERRLTITASDKYGLPTSTDDEVIFGLLQLSRLQGFRSPELVFTRYQLLKILRWQPTTKNYRRMEQALERAIGVTFYYKKAWRDKQTGEWKNASFHLIDNVEIHKKGNRGGVLAPDGHCYVKWNERVFRNFSAGNLRSIDFQLFTSLKSSIAKRMFRFLDKRFYHRKRLKFDLFAFCYDKLGLSRSYTDVAQLKRRLNPAIKELEEQRFLQPVSPAERYKKVMRGKWDIIFEAYRSDIQEELAIEVESVTVLESRLIQHGISRVQAEKFVSDLPEERILQDVEHLEFLIAQDKPPKDSSSWLSAALRAKEPYHPPADFKTSAQREQEARETATRAEARRKAKEQRKSQEKQAQELREREAKEEKRRVVDYLAQLSDRELLELEKEALRAFNGAKDWGATAKQAAVHSHVVKILERRP